MRKTLIVLALLSLCVGMAWAQQETLNELYIKSLVPFSEMKRTTPGLTLDQYNAAVRVIAQAMPKAAPPSKSYSPPSLSTFGPTQESPKYLGRLSSKPFASDSTANDYGTFGSAFSPSSINNRFGTYGSPYSPKSATNPYGLSAPKLYGQDGTYLGKLSSNPYDPQSVSNPFGIYGSPYSPKSINNPYSLYGSPYSPLSPNNPYATKAPIILSDEK